MLDNATSRREAARAIAADAMRDSDDPLSEFDRNIIGADSVQVRLPLRDPVECRLHLAMIEETAHRLRLLLEGRQPNRSLLFMVRGEVRALHKKLNAYRTPRKE